MNSELKQRYYRLAFATVVLLFSGIIYAWTTIGSPYKELGWEFESTVNYTITMCMFCISGFASGLVSKKISIRTRLIIAGLCCGFGMWIATLTDYGVLTLFIGYGFMTGTGVGIAYNVIISATNAFFPDKKGLASGIMMMGFGLGSFVLGLVAKELFSIEAFGWKNTYIIFGTMLGVLLLISALVIRNPLKETVFPDSQKKTDFGKDIDTVDVIKRPSFWKLWIFFMLFAAVGSTAIAGAGTMISSLGFTGNVTVLALTVPVCNSFGRISCGLFFDSFGLRKTQLLSSFVVIAATGITLAGFISKCTVIGIIGLLLCGFSYGFSPTVSSAFTSAFYGMKAFPLNFSLLNLILIPASFFPTLSAMLVESTSSYIPTFAILLGISCLGLCLNVTIKKP